MGGGCSWSHWHFLWWFGCSIMERTIRTFTRPPPRFDKEMMLGKGNSRCDRYTLAWWTMFVYQFTQMFGSTTIYIVDNCCDDGGFTGLFHASLMSILQLMLKGTTRVCKVWQYHFLGSIARSIWDTVLIPTWIAGFHDEETLSYISRAVMSVYSSSLSRIDVVNQRIDWRFELKRCYP